MDARYSLLVIAVGITLAAGSTALVVSDQVAAEEPQANLPLITGFYDGQEVQYVVTDITDPDSVSRIDRSALLVTSILNSRFIIPSHNQDRVILPL